MVLFFPKLLLHISYLSALWHSFPVQKCELFSMLLDCIGKTHRVSNSWHFLRHKMFWYSQCKSHISFSCMHMHYSRDPRYSKKRTWREWCSILKVKIEVESIFAYMQSLIVFLVHRLQYLGPAATFLPVFITTAIQKQEREPCKTLKTRLRSVNKKENNTHSTMASFTALYLTNNKSHLCRSLIHH
jgi:hypothetical protein